jgi:glycosyltransferase involved in cell wall biosynthesis
VNQVKIKLLFVTEATTTGAPLLLLSIIRELVKDPQWDITVMVKRHGELVREFKQVATTYVVKGKGYDHKNPTFGKRIIRFLGSIINKFRIYPRLFSTQLIISNTLTNGVLLHELRFVKAPVICYVHELQRTIECWRPQMDVLYSLAIARLFIAPTDFIGRSLIQNNGVPAGKVRTFNTFVPFKPMPDIQEQKAIARQKFLNKFSLPQDSFLVVGMGTADSRKGIDLFIKTASIAIHSKPTIHFVWIGSYNQAEVEKLLSQNGLANNSGSIIFTGQYAHSLLNLLPFDLFFLSSREDPYPLVVLEAAALEIPAACFEGSGGTVDFVANGCGFPINNWSTEEASRTIVYLSDNRQLLREAGSNAFTKFEQQHTNVELMKSQFFEFVNQVLKIEKSVK